jgi:transposase-like protein
LSSPSLQIGGFCISPHTGSGSLRKEDVIDWGQKEALILVTITITVRCRHCGSEDLVRDGHAPNGKQKYRCKSCNKRSRENPTTPGYTEERREEIIKSYQERSSMRGITRTFGVARNTVKDWLKKSSQPPSLEAHIGCTRSR